MLISPSQFRMRVLVVDDDAANLEICAAYLAELGHTDVTTAAGAAECLAAVDSALLPFDCLLVDIQMPGLSGIDVTRQLRARPGYERTPILMITARTHESAIKDAFDAGATDFISKPVALRELRDRIEGAVGLLHEGDRLDTLRAVMNHSDWHDLSRLGFHEPAPLPRTEMLVDFAALQNMVQVKTRLGVMNSSALCFHIENGRTLFDALERRAFVDLLADVADTVIDVMRPMRPTLAYAGRGDFVALLADARSIEGDMIGQAIDAAMTTLHHFAGHAPDLCPRLRVGAMVRPERHDAMAGYDLLARARGAVRRLDAA